MIQLFRPGIEYENDLEDFKQEFFLNGEKSIPGSELLDKMESFSEWLEYVSRNADIDRVSEDWVVTDTFIALEDSLVVGIICLRHELNDFFKDFGHVGYSVRPSKRNNGIATDMLKKVLKIAEDIGLKYLQLSAFQDNIASCKTITKCGGEYLRSYEYLENTVNIYRICLK